MACIWKHPQSQFFYARFKDERGIIVNRSTKTTDASKAGEIARGLEHASKLARAGNLTQERTRSLLSEILERNTDNAESIRSETVESFFKSHVQTLEGTVSEGTLARYEGVMSKFLEHLGPRAKRVLNGILPKDVQAYVNQRSKEVESSTIAGDLKDLSAVFNTAIKMGYMDRNPALGIKRPKSQPIEREVFTNAQIRALVAEAQDDWKTAVLCGYYSGARLGDVVKLRWEHVNFTSGEVGAIVFRQSKTGKRVVIPLVPELREHLESIARDENDPYIMPTLALRRPGGRNGLSGTFIRILEKTGIDPSYVKGKGKRFAKLSFHSLRHTFNSAMANAGVSQEVRMKLTGHQSGAMNNAYTHHEHKILADAMNQIPRLLD